MKRRKRKLKKMIRKRGRKRIEKVVGKAREFLIEEIPKREKECEENGHQNISWCRYVITSRSSYDDKVSGMCHYCLESFERNLNSKEVEGIRKFWESMRKPIENYG